MRSTPAVCQHGTIGDIGQGIHLDITFGLVGEEVSSIPEDEGDTVGVLLGSVGTGWAGDSAVMLTALLLSAQPARCERR